MSFEQIIHEDSVCFRGWTVCSDFRPEPSPQSTVYKTLSSREELYEATPLYVGGHPIGILPLCMLFSPCNLQQIFYVTLQMIATTLLSARIPSDCCQPQNRSGSNAGRS